MRRGGIDGPEEDRRGFAARFMPAIPPADAPCGRTADAGKVQQLRIRGHEDEVVAHRDPARRPTTSSPGLSAMISSSGLTGNPGATRLTTPWAVPSAIGSSESSETRPSTRSFLLASAR